MNERIRELAQQAGEAVVTEIFDEYMLTETSDGATLQVPAIFIAEFAKLLIQECDTVNKQQSYELAGVVIDSEDGEGFDQVCLNTVKRVETYLAGKTLSKHFGVEE